MVARCDGDNQPSGFEEDFLLLSRSLLLLYKQVGIRLSRVPALRSSTREELFRRLQIGREYIHNHVEVQFARRSVPGGRLSRYHFHRAFTQTFQTTPHAYLTEVRLARAHALLRSGLPPARFASQWGLAVPLLSAGCSEHGTESRRRLSANLENCKIGSAYLQAAG